MKSKYLLISLVVLGIFGFYMNFSKEKILWIIPSDSICKSNGGKVKHNSCYANWSNAKKICSASGGSLPSIDILKKVIIECGGTPVKVVEDKDWKKFFDKNGDNKLYQVCYKKKGFSSNCWSSSSVESNENLAWFVGFNSGDIGWNTKTYSLYVHCVKDE